ncbi:MAG: error-prone DNA polymerase [Alphaproteobacteria bacterium]
MTGYAELQVTTNFSFLQGASHPQELVAQAAALGLTAIAVTDRNSLAGAVRMYQAAQALGLRLVVGARLDFTTGESVLVYPTDRAAYGRLSQLLTLGRRRAPKGESYLAPDDLIAAGEGLLVALLPPPAIDDACRTHARALADAFGDRCYLVAHAHLTGRDAGRLAAVAALGRALGIPLLATNDVRYHHPGRKKLADALTCIREKCTIDDAGWRLEANAERHLKAVEEMAALFKDYPQAIAKTREIVERCRFGLDELRYDYPQEVLAGYATAQEALEALTATGAAWRFPRGVPDKVRQQLDHELALIGQLGYAAYFLTVYDIVRFAREQEILCQGRGSAANSAVCYCLGITAVDPTAVDLLFERFISAARNEPPDIDVDFEHERREEVIQYIYGKYGRHRAGLTATVISYRARSAVREIGKAMGLSEDAVSALAGQIWGWSSDGVDEDRVREAGLDPSAPRVTLTLELTGQLIGFPRHLSQHVGGFVIARERLDDIVPIENAAMEDRTVIEWDKDDIDALGILKVDVLALGMLTCLRKGFDLLHHHYGVAIPDIASVPTEDPKVYDMLCEGDSIGVFQVESRAQMNFLPRMRPRTFYDLVIEVAIIRPGPIQGDMVHPYLRRRRGEETVTYPSPELEAVLGKTLGVPLFQEQAMKIAIVGAGFTPEEADQLRRAMATFRKTGTIHHFREKMIEGMIANGYDPAFSERCFRQIEGFGEYGFPESHAASFALLAYVSSWLKYYYPAAFACALLNSQPMGFYAPAQIVRDAANHGVEVLPADVNASFWDYTLEPGAKGDWALRIGLRQLKGLRQDEAERLVTLRDNGYPDPMALWRRAGLQPRSLAILARADSFGSMGLGRRQALWAVRGLDQGKEAPLPLFAHAQEPERGPDPPVQLPPMPLGEEIVEDYVAARLSLREHPLALLRGEMAAAGVTPNADLLRMDDGRPVTVAGIVLVRQRPGTASGVIFITIEDETGWSNIVVWPDSFTRFRKAVMRGRLLLIRGRLQREGSVIHVIAARIEDRSDALDRLSGLDGPVPTPIDRADAVSRPHSGRRQPGTHRHPRNQTRSLFPSRDFH